MRVPIHIVAVVLFALAGSPSIFAAGATTAPASPPVKPNPAIAVLKQAQVDLDSNDPDRAASAVKSIREMIVTRKNDAALTQGTDLLLKARKFDEVDSMCVAAILAHPDVPYWVSKCQRTRAIALLGQDKNDQALSAAKAYYNVALISETNDAINVVAMCLAKAQPDGKELAVRFRRQQSAWSSPKYKPGATRPSSSATQPSANEDLGDPILSTIKIDPKPFQEAIDAIVAEKYGSYVARGNLLLLCDQAKDANDAFEQSMDVATGDRVPAAVQNMARAIRAANGCLGPAKAYIASLQDKTSAPQ